MSKLGIINTIINNFVCHPNSPAQDSHLHNSKHQILTFFILCQKDLFLLEKKELQAAIRNHKSILVAKFLAFFKLKD